MSFIGESDDEFERALLRSASCDAPGAGASEHAWTRFATTTASIAGANAAPTALPAGPQTTVRVGRFAPAMKAAKWVVVGAIGGSALTFALVASRAPARGPTGTSNAPVAPTADVAAPAPVVMRPIVEAEPNAALDGHRSANGATALPSSHSPAHPSAVGSLPSADSSSLAAEVAALDAARSSLATGAADEALDMLARYLRSFPKGKLVPEAEVMAIEAHAAKGDCARVVREATRFLQHHPTAPQRTRVEQLRAEAACE